MNIIVYYTDNEIEIYSGDYALSPEYVEISNVRTEDSNADEYVDVIIPLMQVRKLEIEYGR